MRICASAIGATRPPRAARRCFRFYGAPWPSKARSSATAPPGSDAHVTNGKAFSYPGYNEMTTGFPNDAIDRNEFGPNPTPTVFEWLNHSDEFRGRVAVYGTWQIFDDIFNKARSGLVMQTGWTPPVATGDAARVGAVAAAVRDDDAIRRGRCRGFAAAGAAPRLCEVGDSRGCLFVGYGETDNWAHQGRYDLVLDSAHRIDGFVKELWDTMQAMPEYRGTTTFIITCDHGRGSGLSEWKEHGVEEKGSENIWIAVIGPDTSPLGERTHTAPVTQSQIAATVAALLGKDYHAAVPRAALPIADVLH